MRKKQGHPSTSVGRYRMYSPTALTNAYKAVQERKLPIRTAARKYNVPHNTLRDRVKGRIDPETVKSGPLPLFSLEEEAMFLGHINHMASLGYGYTLQEVVDKASNYAVHLGKRQKDHPLSVKWFEGFRERWNLNVSKPRSLTNCRAKSLNKDVVNQYFDDLETVLKSNNLTDKPHCIYNFDEKGVQTETKPPFVVSQMSKMPSISASRTAITTILGCGNALGTQIPPFFVFKGKRMNGSLMEGSSPGSDGTVSETGWSNSDIFLHYLQNHFLKFVQRESRDQKILLLFDGHKSHINLPVIQWAQANNIILFVLPAHTSHALQPLDVGCFGPLQKIYDYECHKLMRNCPQTVITRFDVAAIASKAYTSALSIANLRSAFSKTGIYPFNKDTIDEHQFAPSVAFQAPIVSEEACNTVSAVTEKVTNSSTNSLSNCANMTTGLSNRTSTKSYFQQSEQCIINKQVHNSTKKQREVTISGLVSGKEITHASIINEMERNESQKYKKVKRAVKKNANSVSRKVNISPCEPSTSGHPSSKPSQILYNASDSSDYLSDNMSESEKCCVCHLFEPKELRECVSLVFTKWGQCDFTGCEHWTHLKFCCETKVLRRNDTFICPCHQSFSEE